ncbi:uncharacterized protein V6R79_000775 [Siganus canaliculatus]
MVEKVTPLSGATVVDPRFKELWFCNQSCARIAAERLTQECADVMRADPPPQSQPESPARVGPSGQAEDGGLWALLDGHVGAEQHVTSTTASATVEVQSPASASMNTFRKELVDSNLADGRTRNRIDTLYIVSDKPLIPCQATSSVGAFELFKSHYELNLSYDE